jgi:peptidoglycan/LPS O-acetylase OafA/YrhL
MNVSSRVVLQTFTLTAAFQFGIAIVAVLVSGMIFFRLFERPFMRPDWPARVRDRMRTRNAHL